VFGRGGANPLEEMMREMDALDRQLGSAYAFSPACDITESSSGYTLTAELPGLRREDVAIELEEEGSRGNTLLLRGSKESTHSEPEESSVDSDDGVRRVERTYGSFSRRWRLPPEVDTSNISASMRNGVLTVNVPKAQRKQQGKVIDISTSDE
jgi:HSP20 family protein